MGAVLFKQFAMKGLTKDSLIGAAGVFMLVAILMTAPFWLYLMAFNYLNKNDDDSNHP